MKFVHTPEEDARRNVVSARWQAESEATKRWFNDKHPNAEEVHRDTAIRNAALDEIDRRYSREMHPEAYK